MQEPVSPQAGRQDNQLKATTTNEKAKSSKVSQSKKGNGASDEKNPSNNKRILSLRSSIFFSSTTA